MKVANCEQMREIDRTAIEELGIPGIVLMENAALKVLEQIKDSESDITYKSIIIFCGKGNNGGDGFAVARHLFNMGANVLVVLLGDKKEIKGDALTNYSIIEKLGVKIVEVKDDTHLEEIAASLYLCDLVIDAILGTGTKGRITGVTGDVIQLINFSGRHTISIDIPSGINGDTGEICGDSVSADRTVTFVLPKIGLFSYPAADYVGKLIVADISIPNRIIQAQNININIVEKEYIKDLLPVRRRDSNKGDYGSSFIVAGSEGMAGAAAMTALACLRTGSGLVTLGVPRTLSGILAAKLTEAMVLPLEDDENGVISVNSIVTIVDKANRADVVVVGPGLSGNESIISVTEAILSESYSPVVVDADGINALSTNINVLKQCKCPVILTPHPGEMSRLTGLTVQHIQANRIEIARSFAQEWNVYLVLKGARTITAFPDGSIYINSTGNPGMATGGTGDALAGMIASLVGQGISIGDAAVAGVYLHGLSGDIAASSKGEYSLIATDLIEAIPSAIQTIIPF